MFSFLSRNFITNFIPGLVHCICFLLTKLSVQLFCFKTREKEHQGKLAKVRRGNVEIRVSDHSYFCFLFLWSLKVVEKFLSKELSCVITDLKKPGTTNLTLSGNRGVSILITTFCARKCALLLFVTRSMKWRAFAYCFITDSSNYYNNDHNDNVKKRLVCKQELCTCITFFSTFLWRRLHDYGVKSPNATFYGGRGHTTTNSPFSFWTWIKSL